MDSRSAPDLRPDDEEGLACARDGNNKQHTQSETRAKQQALPGNVPTAAYTSMPLWPLLAPGSQSMPSLKSKSRSLPSPWNPFSAQLPHPLMIPGGYAYPAQLGYPQSTQLSPQLVPRPLSERSQASSTSSEGGAAQEPVAKAAASAGRSSHPGPSGSSRSSSTMPAASDSGHPRHDRASASGGHAATAAEASGGRDMTEAAAAASGSSATSVRPQHAGTKRKRRMSRDAVPAPYPPMLPAWPFPFPPPAPSPAIAQQMAQQASYFDQYYAYMQAAAAQHAHMAAAAAHHRSSDRNRDRDDEEEEAEDEAAAGPEGAQEEEDEEEEEGEQDTDSGAALSYDPAAFPYMPFPYFMPAAAMAAAAYAGATAQAMSRRPGTSSSGGSSGGSGKAHALAAAEEAAPPRKMSKKASIDVSAATSSSNAVRASHSHSYGSASAAADAAAAAAVAAVAAEAAAAKRTFKRAPAPPTTSSEPTATAATEATADGAARVSSSGRTIKPKTYDMEAEAASSSRRGKRAPGPEPGNVASSPAAAPVGGSKRLPVGILANAGDRYGSAYVPGALSVDTRAPSDSRSRASAGLPSSSPAATTRTLTPFSAASSGPTRDSSHSARSSRSSDAVEAGAPSYAAVHVGHPAATSASAASAPAATVAATTSSLPPPPPELPDSLPDISDSAGWLPILCQYGATCLVSLQVAVSSLPLEQKIALGASLATDSAAATTASLSRDTSTALSNAADFLTGLNPQQVLPVRPSCSPAHAPGGPSGGDGQPGYRGYAELYDRLSAFSDASIASVLRDGMRVFLSLPCAMWTDPATCAGEFYVLSHGIPPFVNNCVRHWQEKTVKWKKSGSPQFRDVVTSGSGVISAADLLNQAAGGAGAEEGAGHEVTSAATGSSGVANSSGRALAQGAADAADFGEGGDEGVGAQAAALAHAAAATTGTAPVHGGRTGASTQLMSQFAVGRDIHSNGKQYSCRLSCLVIHGKVQGLFLVEVRSAKQSRGAGSGAAAAAAHPSSSPTAASPAAHADTSGASSRKGVRVRSRSSKLAAEVPVAQTRSPPRQQRRGRPMGGTGFSPGSAGAPRVSAHSLRRTSGGSDSDAGPNSLMNAAHAFSALALAAHLQGGHHEDAQEDGEEAAGEEGEAGEYMKTDDEDVDAEEEEQAEGGGEDED